MTKHKCQSFSSFLFRFQWNQCTSITISSLSTTANIRIEAANELNSHEWWIARQISMPFVFRHLWEKRYMQCLYNHCRLCFHYLLKIHCEQKSNKPICLCGQVINAESQPVIDWSRNKKVESLRRSSLPKPRTQSKNKAVRFTWSEQFHYRLNYYLSTSPLAKLVLLLSGTFLSIAFGAALLVLVHGSHGPTLPDTRWCQGDSGYDGFLCHHDWGDVSICLDDWYYLRCHRRKSWRDEKGKSRGIESDHTLMLRWNDKSLAIIQQIAFANESEGGGVIVVLAEQDKDKLEETLQAAVDLREINLQLHGTMVVFWSGNPLMEHDLEKVSVLTAHSIIALSPDEANPNESDSWMVHQVLALWNAK